jgi:hypothetical protein
VITASEPSGTAPFSGLSPRQFGKLISALRREGATPVHTGRPWGLLLEDRVGTLVPTRDHVVAEQSTNYRYSTTHQVVIDADARLVVAVDRPLPGNRNDCKAWELSGAKAAVGKTTVIADAGYRGTGLLIPHRREPGQAELTA